MKKTDKRSSFTGTLGFIMAAAGSAVGLGNIWRFPYLAAKDGGGIFILFYLVLVLTFGFTLLTTEIAIGRKTAQSPLTAYDIIKPGWKFTGVLACLVPVIILPYYCAIGGWVIKYLFSYIAGEGQAMTADNYFTGFISETVSPIVFTVIFIALTAGVIFAGVDNGIERLSKVLMPALIVMVIGISVYSITISHTDEDGITRTGLEGLKIYLIPDFTEMTFKRCFTVFTDALGQLFFSISVAMGIMVTYGSYVKKDADLMTSINRIELFDTLVAIFAGLMIVPAVYAFMGRDGMSAGPGLMFVSLPKIFGAMGGAGTVIGITFFLMVLFAALTSSISVMEAIVSCIMDQFSLTRRKSAAIVTVYTVIFGMAVCLGYNVLYFELKLPNGSTGQVLDVMDYISNSCLMPLVAFFTCILIGWVAKPDIVIDEVMSSSKKFGRRGLYIVMIKFIAPVLLALLFLQSVGVVKF